jgi:photosystem II stability/assembly factor-like uncharacterized protein
MRTRYALLCAATVLAVTTPSYGDQKRPYPGLHWRSIGPAISGGRATAVAGTDDDPFLYYVGTAGGGVFKTTDGGAHWQSVWKKQPVGPIGAVAIAPHRDQIIWVGTGESNPRNDVSYGNGVYVSTNGGDSWQHRGLDETSQISRILVDPRNPKAALVAALGDPFKDSAARGVYRTIDGGKTWTKTLYAGPSSGASDLAWNPLKPSVVFAGMWQYRRTGWSATSGGPDDGLFRSVNGGATWTKLQGHGLPDGEQGRIGVAVAPSNPNRVYAIIETHHGLLWRSDDGGNTWQFATANTLMDQRPFYYSHVYVDPKNENHLLAVSVNLAESNDGGKTWKRNQEAVHGDHHDIWWAADGRRIANANDGGTAISIDGGASWEWRNNYAAGQVYRIGYDFGVPYTVCGGLQDNDGWCAPSTSVGGIADRDWTDVGGGDSTWVWPDPSNPAIVWVAAGGGYSQGQLGLYDRRSGQSTDISPYQRDTDAIGVADLPYRFNWESPLVFSPQDPHVAYFGGNVVWKTVNRGRHWAAISPDLTLNDKLHQQVSGGLTHDGTGAEIYDTVLDIAPSALASGVMWVGTDDGLVQLTRDGGVHWSAVTMPGVGPYGRVATIEPSHFRASQAFAIVDRHYAGDRAPYIFETDDYGATWRSLAANLPKDQFVRTIRQDPHNARVLYAGLEQSVWVSFDGGASWESLQLNLPAVSVRDLRIHPRDNDLIAGTHGRSIWILDDVTPLQMLDRAKAAKVYLYQPRTAYELLSTPGGEANGGPSAFSGESADYGALISYYLSAPAKGTARIDIADAAGHVVRHLGGTHDGDGKQVPDVPAEAGVNRVAWDLNFDRSTPWKSAPKWNRDAVAAVPVAPGTYTALLRVSGRTLSRTFEVKADPRAPWSSAQEIPWRAFAVEIATRMSAVDEMLNRLDELDKNLDNRTRESKGKAPVGEAIAAMRSRVALVRASLTSNPQNDQDDDFLPDMLRERLQALSFTDGGARTPPTPAQLSELAALSSLQAKVSADYARLTNDDLGALNAALKGAGLKTILP